MTRSIPIAALALIAVIQCEAFTTPITKPALFTPPSYTHHRNTHRMASSSPETKTEESSSSSRTTQQEMMDEASDALASVGWSRPLDDGEMTSDDPFVQRIDESIQRDMGVSLDELLNPAKVVNLERDLFNLRSELAVITGKGDMNVGGLSTSECDGGGGGEEADKIRASIDKKEKTLLVERRAVFRGWLKNVFLGQAVLSLGLSWFMVTDPGVLFGGNDWYYSLNLEMPIKVLGFWWWWLFIVPSLRSRRPSGAEKKALDIAFLGTPLISLVAPIATKDTAIIWAANLAVVAGAYAFAFTFDSDDDEEDEGGSSGPAWLKFIYKSLDFGSGRERGARS
eukprot:CAMPEP_0185727140 /NCGR_PEP_ID=MMETSP1171-20130828/2905_1 /TAXON_ID=374046 /ORGANISM="Helicotheca tamensis, Strain CCMP826" /LENGTH=338 /DNA_ID=CAMNT_0028395645 /DNA_START=140 /DNA_END=1156 /DNA_ORIENTATION=+